MQAFAQDSLSNLAASLNAGKDKAAADSFFVFDLGRGQIEAMYRGDWLARKIVDVVPHDMVRDWREWAGERSAVAAAEAAERKLNLRKVVQRALTLGRLYGGAAILVGTGAEHPAELAAELDPESVRPGDVKFLQVLSRWQLAVPAVNRDPLDRWCGEPAVYELSSPERGTLRLHPSRVVRVLGNECPDPGLGVSLRSGKFRSEWSIATGRINVYNCSSARRGSWTVCSSVNSGGPNPESVSETTARHQSSVR